jgi:phosphoribosyl 1,2-cyclic phosphate phosphodiesterase
MSESALRKVLVRFGKHQNDSGLHDPVLQDVFNVTAHAIKPFQTFDAGPYHVTSVAAAHAWDLVPMLHVIERGGRTLFYATDTGPLLEATWQALIDMKFRFNVVAMDHTMGTGSPSDVHMNQTQFVEQLTRMRDSGLLADDARVYAHHFAHHSNALHDALEAEAATLGYRVTYDGLTVEV